MVFLEYGEYDLDNISNDSPSHASTQHLTGLCDNDGDRQMDADLQEALAVSRRLRAQEEQEAEDHPGSTTQKKGASASKT